MRVRFGLGMAPKGGRATLIGVEVQERARFGSYAEGSPRRTEHVFHVGTIERVPGTIEAASSRLVELMTRAKAVRPCAIVDIGTPQGQALHKMLRGRFPPELHQAHAYPGTGARAPLFAGFLEAYSSGRITFAPDLPHRKDLDKALVFYMGGGVAKHGLELSSEEEAMVIALGLALAWPKHGPEARPARD